MKTLRQIEDRILTAIMVVALMVPLVLVAISQGSDLPTLSFEGARIQVVDEGDGTTSLQLLFEVCISHVEKTAGAQFDLSYNTNYIIPSRYADNEIIESMDTNASVFCYNPELYQEYRKVDETTERLEPANPFENVSAYVAYDEADTGWLTIELFTKSELSGVGGKKVEYAAEGSQGTKSVYVFDASEKLVLGTLSFRVVDPAILPEIVRRFDGLGVEEGGVLLDGNHAKDVATDAEVTDADKLIYFEERATVQGANPWGIGMLEKIPDSEGYRYITVNDANDDQKARATFTYHFDRTVIDVKAVEPEVTVDAYQAYTDGTVSDLDIVLQKYSPMVLVKYSDGSQANVILPWGRSSNAVDGLDWSASVATIQIGGTDLVVKDEVTKPDEEVVYDPTASGYDGHDQGDYLVSKGFHYLEGGVDKTFPIPVRVKLTVTPITLVDVTANDLFRVYPLGMDLVSGDTSIQTLGDLELPDVARLVTDRPAGGASLTMPIQGWSHVNKAGTDPESDPAVYWPYISGTTGKAEMGDLWRDDATDDDTVTSKNYLHWPTVSDYGNGRDENEDEDNGKKMGENRSGDYTFRMAASYGTAPVAGFTRPEIQAAYPWLTIPESGATLPGDVTVPEGLEYDDIWPVGDALRRIVWSEQEGAKTVVDASTYVVRYVSTTTNFDEPLANLLLPDLTLQVTKRGTGAEGETMAPGTLFRIRMPNGEEVGIGPVGDVELEDWFDAEQGESGSYTRSPNDETNPTAFDLILNPGDTTDANSGTHKDARERLLRYINLGGWFAVSVNEKPVPADDDDAPVEADEEAGEGKPVGNYWTDFIPVYVPPRENIHLESKVYNFLGENADLYSFVDDGSGAIPTTVTLPAGAYTIVDAQGQPVYEEPESGDDEDDGYGEGDDEDDEPVERPRVEERYGLKTLYDGVTGAQFGELHTFTIQPEGSSTTWTKPTPDPATTVDGATIIQYGANDFMDNHAATSAAANDGKGAPYGAYGWVRNLGEPTKDGYKEELYDATVRIESDKLITPEEPTDPDNPDPEEMLEKIKLIYNGEPGGVTPYYAPDTPVLDRENVNLVTFDTKTEGYDLRQEYTLTIVNVGDVPIYGLSIDMLTDSLGASYQLDGGGGHFTIIRPPASFLPVGGSTDFTLSYNYNLAGDRTAGGLEYLDKLYITSDSKHKVTADPGKTLTAGVDYLLDFDAQFHVTQQDIHRVWVVYRPTDGVMGTAQVIMGKTNLNDNTPLNTSAGSNAAATGSTVFVMATPTDEYRVGRITAVTASNTVLFDLDMQENGVTDDDAIYKGDIYYSSETITVGRNTQIQVWLLTMPDEDVTVTVYFYEPDRSKLRLLDLTTFASADVNDLVNTGTNGAPSLSDPKPTADRAPFERKVWEKTFDPGDDSVDPETGERLNLGDVLKSQDWKYYPEDYKNDARSNPPTEEDQGIYLMTLGSAVRRNFDSSKSQYLVVIPADAEYVQVEIALRGVEYDYDGYGNVNKNLEDVNVIMTWFPDQVSPFVDSDDTPFNFDTTAEDGKYQIYEGSGSPIDPITNAPSVHTSSAFQAPRPGTSSYVRVRLQAGTSNVFRYYFVEIHRPPLEPVATLNYGNSPYGMIMNDAEIADKEAAKKAFVDNNYSFAGIEDLDNDGTPAVKLVPTVVKKYGLENLHYWSEAWVAVDALYEPESGLGFDYIYDAEKGEGTLIPSTEPYPIYVPENNLDLNDFTLFGIMGESVWEPGLTGALDSTGRPAQVDKAVLYVEAYRLDTEDGIPQTERFGLPAAPGEGASEEEVAAYNEALEARTVELYRHHPAGGLVENWDREHISDDEGNLQDGDYLYLRPGRYKLIYIIPDYDYYQDYTDATIPDDWEPEDGPTLRVERPFVILAPVGDVNADLAKTQVGTDTTERTYKTKTDYELVRGRITNPLGYMADGYADADGAIFKFRTVDVNNDRNINNIDANTIREGKGVERFYLTTDYIYPSVRSVDLNAD